MSNTKTFEELRDLLRHELDALTKKGEVTKESLDHFYKLTCTIKNIEKILEYESSQEGGMSNRGGYSQRMMPMYMYDGGASNRGSYGGGYNSYDGSSYRGSYDGRAGRDGDSDGRYSEDGSYNWGRNNNSSRGNSGRYSREGQSNDGYSRHTETERMIEQMESLMANASSEKERQAIRRCIESLEG